MATRAGATSATWNVDKDGVDVTLKRRGTLVEFQMKCTFSPVVLGSGEAYAFDLDVPTYDVLRDSERSAAGFLGLVVVPRELDDWLEHGDTTLLMNCSGYYAQIQDLPAVSNKATKTIHLPKKQRLDLAGLDAIFEYAHHRLFGQAEEGAR